MNTKPMVSVVMPAYNHDKYVGEAIESVLNQTYRNFEFIIINDGSTDNTEEVIKSYTDSRIRCYSQKNMDAPYTINRGIAEAKGEYISIINSDDVYHPERLALLSEEAEKKYLKLLITDISFIDGSSEILPETAGIVSWHKHVKSLYREHGSLYRSFLRSNIAVTSSNLFFHNTVPDEIGMFKNYRFVHDYDFIFRALCKFGERCEFLIERKYLFYRLHGKNTINKSFLGKNAEDIYLHIINLLRLASLVMRRKR